MRLWNCPKSIQPLLDWLWPHVYHLTSDEEAQEKEKSKDRKIKYERNLEQLKTRTELEVIDALAACEKIDEAEKDRQRSVESRLISILGMTSIASALFGVFITVQTKMGDQKLLDGFTIPLLVTFVYGMTQLFRALLAAVKGLKRRSQIVMTEEDYIPSAEESRVDCKIRTLKELLGKIQDDEKVNSRRTDQLEMAHVALRNFLFAMLLLAFLWPLMPLHTEKPFMDTEAVLKAIKSDTSLLERLRGPSGPPGTTQPITLGLSPCVSCSCKTLTGKGKRPLETTKKPPP